MLLKGLLNDASALFCRVQQSSFKNEQAKGLYQIKWIDVQSSLYELSIALLFQILLISPFY